MYCKFQAVGKGVGHLELIQVPLLDRELKEGMPAEQQAAAADGPGKGSVNRNGSAAQLPVEVTNETLAAARGELYRTQSCIFITTRILVVDLLTNRLQAHQVLRICAKHLPATLIKSRLCDICSCLSLRRSTWLAGTIPCMVKRLRLLEEVNMRA